MSEDSRRTRTDRWSTGTEFYRTTAMAARNEAAFGTAGGAAPDPDQTLRQNEARLHSLLGIIPDFVFVVRKDGVVSSVQSSKGSEFVLPNEDVVGKRLMELLPMQIGLQAMHYLEKTLRLGTTQTFHAQIQIGGGLRDFEGRMAVWSKSEIVALVRDVADRRLLQKEILEISQRERTRIGQDLHDGLGQHLTGITFLTKALQNRLRAKGISEADEVEEIGQLVFQALTQTRSLARGLFPVEVEVGGLTQAFKELANTAEQLFQIVCRIDCAEEIEIGSNTVATHLFRLAQEAISNSVKHGKAKEVVISLRSADDQWVLSVADDGVGFARPAAGVAGLGLRIMHYRAQKIGGSLEILAGAQGGTVVSCTFRNRTDEV